MFSTCRLTRGQRTWVEVPPIAMNQAIELQKTFDLAPIRRRLMPTRANEESFQNPT